MTRQQIIQPIEKGFDEIVKAVSKYNPNPKKLKPKPKKKKTKK